MDDRVIEVEVVGGDGGESRNHVLNLVHLVPNSDASARDPALLMYHRATSGRDDADVAAAAPEAGVRACAAYDLPGSQ